MRWQRLEQYVWNHKIISQGFASPFGAIVNKYIP